MKLQKMINPLFQTNNVVTILPTLENVRMKQKLEESAVLCTKWHQCAKVELLAAGLDVCTHILIWEEEMRIF